MGCSSIKDAWNADSNIKKVEIGMTKSQVVSIMGNSYDSAGARKSYNGTTQEAIKYVVNEDVWYMLYFEDGKLVEWFKDKPRPTRPQHNTNR